MKDRRPTLSIVIAALALLAGCAAAPSPQEVGRLTQAALKASFRDQGPAKLDRLEQDALQQACSGADPPSAALTAQLEAAQLAAVQWPADGVYLGDWREGEKLAQNGRGMTWSDPAGPPTAAIATTATASRAARSPTARSAPACTSTASCVA